MHSSNGMDIVMTTRNNSTTRENLLNTRLPDMKENTDTMPTPATKPQSIPHVDTVGYDTSINAIGIYVFNYQMLPLPGPLLVMTN